MKECGYSKNDITRLCLQFKTFLLKQNDEHLDYYKTEDESIFDRIPIKQTEAFFATWFEDVTYELSSLLILSLTDPPDI